MPQLGLGTWPMSSAEAERAVPTAIEAGYRLVDTAYAYGNEDGVGAGLRASGLPREELFVTTKLNAEWHGVREVREAFVDSTRKLGVEYLDLYLIHWPNPDQDRYVDAWRGLCRLLDEGLVRAIGVSNFKPAHLERLLESTGVAPDVNQIELNPYLARTEPRAFHEKHGIVTQSYSPLDRGGELLREPVVVAAPSASGVPRPRSCCAGTCSRACRRGEVLRPAAPGGEPRRLRLRAERGGAGGAVRARPRRGRGDRLRYVRALMSLLGEGTTLGGWCHMPGGFAAEVMAAAGFDWILVDRQHGLIGESELFDMLRALTISGTPTFVRVSQADHGEIGRALDGGAHGVVVPQIGSVEEAQLVARACRYAPAGARSIGPTRAKLYDRADPRAADASVLCLPMIESRAGLDAVEAIAAVEGVDGLFVGPADLALDLGVDGRGARRGAGADRPRLPRAGQARRRVRHGRGAHPRLGRPRLRVPGRGLRRVVPARRRP